MIAVVEILPSTRITILGPELTTLDVIFRVARYSTIILNTCTFCAMFS